MASRILEAQKGIVEIVNSGVLSIDDILNLYDQLKEKIAVPVGWILVEELPPLRNMQLADPSHEDQIHQLLVPAIRGEKREAYIYAHMHGKTIAKKVGEIWTSGENKGKWVEGTFKGY